MPQDAARQSLPAELNGSDCEVLVDGPLPSDNSGFKIPDVPKPSTGADEVADWAAEVGVSIFFKGGGLFWGFVVEYTCIGGI